MMSLLGMLQLTESTPVPTARLDRHFKWETRRIDAELVGGITILLDGDAQRPYVRFEYGRAREERHCTMERAFGTFSKKLCVALRESNPSVWDMLPRISRSDVDDLDADEWHLTDAVRKRVFEALAVGEPRGTSVRCVGEFAFFHFTVSGIPASALSHNGFGVCSSAPLVQVRPCSLGASRVGCGPRQGLALGGRSERACRSGTGISLNIVTRAHGSCGRPTEAGASRRRHRRG